MCARGTSHIRFPSERWDGQNDVHARKCLGATTLALRCSCGKSSGFKVMMKSPLPCSLQWQKGSSLGSAENLNRGAHLYFSGPFPNQAYDSPDQVSANAKALQDVLVLVQDILGDKPNEGVSLCPLLEDISAGVSTRSERLSEACDPSHQHACVNNHTRPATLTFRRQL
jgi:hypothetical protein